MNPGTSPEARVCGTQAAARLLALCLLGAAVALMAGCGSAPKRVAAERGGGYYQDDGPGEHPPANLDQIADAEPKIEPLHRFANNPYTVFGRQYVPYKTLTPYKQRGIGSWYGRKFHGQRTSGGESYDMYGMSAAHPTLPIPSYARVTNLANGKSAIVRINDRGPFHSGRLVDLSYAAAYKLGYAGAGSARVEVEAIMREDLPMIAAQRRRTQAITSAAAPVVPRAPVASATPASVALLAAAAPEPEAAQPAPPIPLDTEASGIYLQLGAFSARDNAENFRVRLYQQLAWLNDPIQIHARNGMYRLHLGPYHDRVAAGGMAEKLRDALQFKPVVVVR